LSDAAAEFRAGEPKLIADYPKQRSVRRDVDGMSDSIHCELYGHIVPSLIDGFVVALPANMNGGPDLEPDVQSVPPSF
jgi:hypothetical protein